MAGAEAGRRCRRCRRETVHRQRRSALEKKLSGWLGLRRERCYRCGASQWNALPREERSRWVAVPAMLLVVAVTGAAIYIVSDPSTEAETAQATSAEGTAAVALPPSSAVADPQVVVAQPLPSSAPSTLPATSLKLEEQLPAAPPPAPAAGAVDVVPAAASDAAAPDPAQRTMRRQLVAVTPRWTGEEMEVRIEARPLPAGYSLRYVGSAGGYVLDLPGVWTLPANLRRSRAFTRSDLSSMDIGLHKDFVRFVFRTRQTQPPRVERIDGGFAIYI